MRFLPANAQHIGSRSSQQDSFGFADPGDAAFIEHGGFVAVVCDGMGGMEHGDAASQVAVHAFLQSYREKTFEETIPAALERSVRFANEQVVSLARELGLVGGVGTTLVAIAARESSFHFISVGDSGIFLVKDAAEIHTVNSPHVYANYLDQAVARGELDRASALAHPEREALTSYIGGEVLEEIDQNAEPWPIHPGETILLASDGLFKTLDHREMAACLWGEPHTWPANLVEKVLAYRRVYQDNVTVISVTVPPGEGSAILRERPAAASVPGLPPPLPAATPPAGDPPKSGGRGGTLVGLVLLLAAFAAAGVWAWARSG